MHLPLIVPDDIKDKTIDSSIQYTLNIFSHQVK